MCANLWAAGVNEANNELYPGLAIQTGEGDVAFQNSLGRYLDLSSSPPVMNVIKVDHASLLLVYCI